VRKVLVPLLVATLSSFQAQAQPVSAGAWRINGSISGRTFALDCRLESAGGVCVDTSERGRSHPLTSLAVTGANAQWSFTTKVMIAKIAMRFSGRIDGRQISGQVTAAGRTGTFTGIRN